MRKCRIIEIKITLAWSC